MSIQDKLFGRPKTLDEFVDKAKKKGINKVSILLTAYDDMGSFFGGGLFNYHCLVILSAGKITLKISEHTRARLGNLYQTVIGKAEKARDGLKDAIKTAEKLSELGFEVSINGKSVNEAKEMLAQSDTEIQEKRQEFGLPASLPQSS